MPAINFDYTDVPTIGEFSNCDAFVRGLVGPFGCLPADTEYLTRTGWKPMGSYSDGGEVAQWHEDGHIEFVIPERFHVVPATDLIEFDSGSLVMRLTDEHRVPHYNWKGVFQIRTAADIAAKPSRRTIPTTFFGSAEDGLGMNDDLIRFAVMMHADGHYPPHGRRAVVTVRKDRKKARARELLSRLGIEFAESTYANRPEETVFRFMPPYRGKRFTGKWWRASKRELAIVLEEMRYWDGHAGEIIVYSSKHKEDADFMQYAAHANGLRATISRVDYENENWAPNYRVNIRTSDNSKNRACIREETVIRRVPTPDGKAYCFTVPTGFFIARCDNTIFITGNSGKSSGCVVEFPYRAQRQKPGPDGIRRTRWAVVRNTFRELSDTTVQTFHQWLPPAYFGRWYASDHRYVVKAFPGTEFEVLFRALDRPEDVKKLLSLDITGAWVNEAREIPWAIIDALMGRCGRYPSMKDGGPTWSGIWMDTNPPDTDSEFYAFFEENRWLADFHELKRIGQLPPGVHEPDDFARIFHQPSGLSPRAENLRNLTPGYYARLAIGKSEEWKKVYIRGDYGFVTDDKTVYPEYRDENHLREVNPIPNVPIERNWDFGLTPCCTFSQSLPSGRWIVFDELMATGMGMDRFSDQVLEHCGKAFKGPVTFDDIGDPAGNARAQTDERTCFEIMHAKGIQIYGGEVSEKLRMEAMRKPLRMFDDNGEPAFALHPRCKQTRKALLGGYHYRKMAGTANRYTTDPEKNHPYSDLANTLEYRAGQKYGVGLTTDMGHDDDYPQAARPMGGRSKITGY